MSGMAFHMPVFAYAVSFVDTDQWASPKHHMKGLSRYNSTYPLQKSSET